MNLKFPSHKYSLQFFSATATVNPYDTTYNASEENLMNIWLYSLKYEPQLELELIS